MNHPAELAIHQYLEKALSEGVAFSEETADKIAEDIKEAVKRQFNNGRKDREFTLRMSNIGRPTCQLWYDKNKPNVALPMPNTFIMNMLMGDIVEAVFKGLLTEAGVKYEDTDKVNLDCGDTSISGSYDLILNDAVDDIKSASDWSYRNKFESYNTLAGGDSFGYVAQLAGYAKASNKKAGGWWVVNKSNGQFKYVPATGLNVDTEVSKIKDTISKVETNKFERCFEPEIETFRGKVTGNKVLNKNCSFCSYRFDCWPSLVERPAVKSQAKQPPVVAYVDLRKEYMDE